MDDQSPQVKSELPHLSTSFEPQMDEYLDLEQNAPTSSSTSIASKTNSAMTEHNMAGSAHTIAPQQTFSAPSFQYDSYKQQTGIPTGGLANTFALNQANGMQYTDNNYGFVMPTETLNVPLTSFDDLDFTAYPMMDIDLGAESPTDTSPLTTALSATSAANFVDPNNLSDRDAAAGNTSPIQRMYPGMHSKRAAQAKAQQALKRDKAGNLPHSTLPGQRPLPSTPASHSSKDPYVEESISRLLGQMRKNRAAASTDETTDSANLPSGLARLKKDEDKMDEDERLLASEEGKRLTSKERRQLRNKVSARAFRSRRKEYIGQLEGEVAAKSQEANGLRARNRELVEENNRLTDLTRMLLSSPAFSSFLTELSGTDSQTPAASSKPNLAFSQSESKRVNKDVNPNQATNQLTDKGQQVGMATVDKPVVEGGLLDNSASASASNWAPAAAINFPVYTVLDVPEGPAINLEDLAGKQDNRSVMDLSSTAKIKYPCTDDHPPCSQATTTNATPILQKSGSSSKATCNTSWLHADPLNQLPKSALSSFTAPVCAPLEISSDKTPLSCPASPDDPKDASMVHLQAMCSQLDALSSRIAAAAGHLA